MDDLQKYAFATKGLLIIRNFLAQAEVATALENVDYSKQKSLMIHKNPAFFMGLMSNPVIMDICSELIGKWFRFDHELCVTQNKENGSYLHGGQFGSQGTCTYHSAGQDSWSGQLTVGLTLVKQNRDTGGFAYVPGSHNTTWHGKSGRQLQIWNEVLNSEIVEVPSLNPGDLYFFPESLAHGQVSWRGEESRATFYLKYVPGFMAWQDYEVTKKYLNYATTFVQKDLLRRPYVRMNSPHEETVEYGQSNARSYRTTTGYEEGWVY